MRQQQLAKSIAATNRHLLNQIVVSSECFVYYFLMLFDQIRVHLISCLRRLLINQRVRIEANLFRRKHVQKLSQIIREKRVLKDQDKYEFYYGPWTLQIEATLNHRKVHRYPKHDAENIEFSE